MKVSLLELNEEKFKGVGKEGGRVISGCLCLPSRTDDKTNLLGPKITGKRQFEYFF